MKKSMFILVFVAAVLLGCNTGNAKTGTGEPVASVTSGQENSSEKLTKATFLEKIWDYENSPKEWKFKGDKPVLIDFYADWCGPCKKAAPILEELSKKYEGKIVVYKIDTQVERELAGVFGVQSIPAFLYIPMKGKPTMTSGIARTTEETKQMFEEVINKVLLASN